MKPLYLLLFTALSFNSFAQPEQILPNLESLYDIRVQTHNSNNEWVYNYQSIEFYQQDSTYDTLLAVKNGDLVAKLYIEGEKVFIKRTPSPNSGFRSDFGSDFELLYDFGLQPGDTAYYTYSTEFITVESIDTVSLTGIERKRLNLSNGENG